MSNQKSSMKVVAIVNQKGGATKTTTSAHIAAGAALRGLRTVAIDLDGQCNLTELFGLLPENMRAQGQFTALDLVLGKKSASQALITLEDRFGGNLSIIPGQSTMSKVGATVDTSVATQSLQEDLSDLEADERKSATRLNLRESLASLEGEVDLVVCDAPPSLGFELTSALAAADAYIIPCTPNKYDLSGYKRLEETVDLVRRRYNPNLEFLGVVLSRLRKGTKLHSQVLEGMEARFGDGLLKPIISDSIRFGECPFHGKTIYELVPNDSAAKDLQAITDVVLTRLFGSEILEQRNPVTDAGDEPVVELEPFSPEDVGGPVTDEASITGEVANG